MLCILWLQSMAVPCWCAHTGKLTRLEAALGRPDVAALHAAVPAPGVAEVLLLASDADGSFGALATLVASNWETERILLTLLA